MVSVVQLTIETFALLETVSKLSQQYALMQNNNVTKVTPVEVQPRTRTFIAHRTPIHHYSRHVLCRNFDGKKTLYNALKRKLCDTKLSFTAGFVIDLCRRRDGLLDKWVAELFDIDGDLIISGDGFVTHHEKNVYNNIT